MNRNFSMNCRERICVETIPVIALPSISDDCPARFTFSSNRENFLVSNTPAFLNADSSPESRARGEMLCRHLGVRFEVTDITTILSARPTTDTYSLEQSQDEVYFVLPYHQMDIVLFGLNHGKTPVEVAEETGLTPEQVTRVFRDIQTKRKTTLPLRRKPIFLDRVPEIEF